ncbi:hypothetical protein F2Q69_00062881 [Brassica cretica]|uniref:Uncharacterized protein n=1 Tax=Brassica cretica TaxID=69181 RepID=A0A8S9REC8_BRACR|nr:hypothetical protein F2Q69_00062881 [Brassica cretica]
MEDHILISDGEDPATPLPSLSKRARKDPISAILISDSDPTPFKQQQESSSTPLFVPDTPLSDDFSLVKCSFASGALGEDKFSGKRVISLDSEFEDSPGPETWKKHGPLLADIKEPRCGLDSRSSVADSAEASTGIAQPSFGDNTNWMHEVSVRSSLTNDTIEKTSQEFRTDTHLIREKEEYKNPGSWIRPPIDEVLAKLTTHYVRVHSRDCVDEAEVAEHVVGLTTSLASCQFRKKLTMLSVNANGALVSKDSVDKHLIKKSPWLKALVAIPKVQPRYAIAVWKKYPSMKSLLKVYMDPNISIHEKEFLLKDLKVEGLVGGDIRLGEVCSKRIYRVLISPSGTIKTDDVENGAAFFHTLGS